MQRDYWYSVARTLTKLDAPEKVGKIAAERTLRRLGARKVKTAQVPIVFDPMVATSILEHIFEGVNGDSVYRGASFLAGKLGEKIAGDNVTRHRRRHHCRRLRHQSVRWRRHSHAPHGGRSRTAC